MKMGKNASYVIAGMVVAAVAAVLLVYFVVYSQGRDSEIITQPRIMQEQAIEIVSDNLKNRYPNFNGSDLSLFASGRGQILVEEFLQTGLQLPLIYYHANGTQFRIDSETNSIINSCSPVRCSDFGGAAKNKLAYILEIDCKECGFQHYLVDAVAGTVVYHSPDPLPRNQSNQTLPPYA